ncbi:hypothetical protein LJR220_005383 [Bradyrhizobium sp. LjRoot220]
MATLLACGADFDPRPVGRARWLDREGNEFDLVAELRKASARGLIDRLIWIWRKGGAPLALRLVGHSAQAAYRKSAPRCTARKATRSRSKRLTLQIG